MARNNRHQLLRYETNYNEDEESFTSASETTGTPEVAQEVAEIGASEVLTQPSRPDPRAHGRGGRRSMEDMLASQPNSVMRSAYVLERIATLEDQIAKLIRLCDPEARELVFRQRASLKRYSPE